MHAYEKLGAFYLGRRYDMADGVTDEPVLYDAKDLTTHAVCVGMTGSGKTGLCLSLLEEAAIDGIPAIAIDPKGDIGNLLLTFPELRPEDFAPWVSPEEASRKGQTMAEYAATVAERWRTGLAEWDQDGERIGRMRATADFAVYTPGSNAGRPISLLQSMHAPPQALLADADAFRDRVLSTASGLLTLVGIDPDPVRSREHILLSSLLDQAWREGMDLQMAELIRRIQKPAFERVGVLDLETFFPSKDRFGLAMTLNNLLASPGFAAWMEGDPLDVGRLLWTESGRPRIAILSIAHLSDAERMFFVTMLLDEIVSWMRTQSGSTSLRALLYMDEVFGFFPPVANPPSKTPMLTLLKQARAFGLGVVLATQNPVDLDYKGLSNAGTWFLGRLQTERDKLRVLDGLESAAGSAPGFDRGEADAILSGLPGRVFLMHNVHEAGPVLMHTRWAMSYLRGPMTREEIKKLAGATAPAAAREPARSAPASEAAGVEAAGSRPLVPAGVPEAFVPAPRATSRGFYRPALLGRVRLHYVNARRKVDEWRDLAYLAGLAEDADGDPWESATRLETEPDVEDSPAPGFAFASLPPSAGRPDTYKDWQKALSNYAYRNETLTMWHCPALRTYSAAAEAEGEFRIRLTQEAREQRDLAIEKLRAKYATRIQAVDRKIRTAEERVGREESQYQQQKYQTAISFGATVLGAVFGRKLASVGNIGRATTAARGAGRVGREKDDIARAQESLETVLRQKAELEEQLAAEIADLQAEHDPTAIEIEPVEIRPRKSDISAGAPTLVWVPWERSEGGLASPML